MEINLGNEITFLILPKYKSGYNIHFSQNRKVMVDWFITMAKIKGELLINQKVIPCRVLSTYHVSDIVLATENKMMDRNKVPVLMELIFRWRRNSTNKYILNQAVRMLGVINMKIQVIFHVGIRPLREWGLEETKALGRS